MDTTLIEQNLHWNGTTYSHQFKRLHDETAVKELSLDEIQVVTGIRRAGKSTLLQTLINALMQKKLDPVTILYINFDDPNYTEAYTNSQFIQQIITNTEKMHGKKVAYLLLDEIQNVEGWERYVKSTYDSKRFKKIIISGSNADLLNSHYATLLSGRYVTTHIYPLNFQEYLMAQNITSAFQVAKQKPTVLAFVDQFLQFGGFPRIHCISDDAQRIKLLQSYYETILLKDCIGNHGVRDTKTLITLAHYLMSNVSSLFSYNKLSSAVESNENTVKQFMQFFGDAYLLHEIKLFSYSLKTQNRNKKKVYCIDNGLITASAFQFSQNLGKLFENLVFSEICKQDNTSIHFYHDAKECDFVVKRKNKLTAIQVCYTLTHENRAREFDGLKYAMKQLDINNGLLVTYDQAEPEKNGIIVVPFWKWSLDLLA